MHCSRALPSSIGMAEFVFMYSIPWDNRWWFWHALRLMACLLALGYIGRSYFQVTSDLQTSLVTNAPCQRDAESKRGHGSVRCLTNASAWRRICMTAPSSPFSRSDSISNDANVSCPPLTRMLARSWSRAVAGLKAVIRDLRRIHSWFGVTDLKRTRTRSGADLVWSTT